MDPNIIPLISIIVTGLVSILSIFVPVFLGWQRAKEANASKKEERNSKQLLWNYVERDF